MAQQWFYKVMGQQFGPVSSAELRSLAQHGTISLDTLISNAPNGTWVLAENVNGLFLVSDETPQQISESGYPIPPPVTSPSPSHSHVSNSSFQQLSQFNSRNSFVANNLMPGEKIIYAATIHPIIFIPSCMLFIFMLIGFGMMISNVLYEMGIGLIFFGLIMFLLSGGRALIIFLSTECVLTDKRVIGRVGILNRMSLEIMLNKVESIYVNQGLFGQIFDYGTIVVSGTGGSKTPFQGIAKPLDFRNNFIRQIEKVRQGD
jgi:hypothetical protein